MARASAVYDMVLSDKSETGRTSFLGSIDRIDKRTAALAVGGFAALATAGVGAFTAILATQGPVIDEIGKMSEVLGISVTSLQAMKDAGERADVPLGLIEKSLKKMTAAVSDANNGTGAAVKSLAELGIGVEELNKLAPDEQFKRISDALADVGNRNDQLRLSEDFFGSRGTNLLRLTSSAINDAEKEMRDLGIALTEIDVENVEQMNDAIQRVQRNATGAQQVFLAEMAPAIRSVLDEVFAVDEAIGNVRGTSNGLADGLIEVIGFIGDVFQGLDNSFDFVNLLFAKAGAIDAKIFDFFKGTEDSAAEVVRAAQAAQQLDDNLAGQVNEAAFSEQLKARRQLYEEEAAANAKAIEEGRAARDARAGSDTSGGTSSLTDQSEARAAEAAARAEERAQKAAATKAKRDEAQAERDREQEIARVTRLAEQEKRELEAAERAEEREKQIQESKLERIREAGLSEDQILLERQQATNEFLDSIAANDVSRTAEINAIKKASNEDYYDKQLALIERSHAEANRLEAAQLKAGKSYVEEGIAYFAEQSQAADAIHKGLVAVRMVREGKEAVIGAYKWGNSIGGPGFGAVAAGVAIAYTGALINEAVGGGSGTSSPPSGVAETATDSETAATTAATTEEQQNTTSVIYNAYFRTSDTENRESRAAAELQADIDAKRVDFGPNVQVTTNILDYEDFGT